MDTKLQGIYRHYKNHQKYQVIGIALQTETNEWLIIYKPLYKNEYEYFARPYDMFIGEVEYDGKMVKRFEQVKS